MSNKKVVIGFLALIFAFMLSWQSSLPVLADDSEQRFIVTVDNIVNFPFTDSGVFNTPGGSDSPGPLLPGQVYEWGFYANPGDRLSFATMFVQSNDWFFAPGEEGIPLYRKNGRPINGNVTRFVKLWDAGTEIDQPVGEGPDQAPRQSGPNTGADDPTNYVRQVEQDGIPRVHRLIRVWVRSHGDGLFTLRIKNVSGHSMVPTPLAPGVGVVHSVRAPLFSNHMPDRGLGLEALAEDGNPAMLAEALAAQTGINTPLAPVVWTVQEDEDDNPLFTAGESASAGLESLAEDGSPALLAASLDEDESGVAAVGRGASGPGPIFGPDGGYTFVIEAEEEDQLSLAFMFVQSNDWFYGLDGLDLFDDSGNAISGDVTYAITLYDAGTEIDQTPGFGSYQAPRQPAPNTGPAQGGVVSPVTNPRYSNPASVVQITITAVD